MRPIALIVAAAASLMATAAFAAAPIGPVSQINISIGSWLDQKRIDKVNDRDLAYLKDELRKSVEEQLARTGKLDPNGGGRLDLVLEDAINNRPTQQEMSYYPSLSLKSFANGGAEITGVYVAPDGSRTPIGYVRREMDLGEARYASGRGHSQGRSRWRTGTDRGRVRRVARRRGRLRLLDGRCDGGR